MRLRKVVLFCAFSVAVFAISFNLTGRLKGSTQSCPVFTAESRIENFDAAGRLIRSFVSIFGQRADCSTVLAMPIWAPIGVTKNVRMITFPNELWRATLQESTESRQTTALSPQGAAFLLASNSGCQDARTGTRSVFGYQTYKVVRRSSEGRFIDEEWRAPDLSCFALERESSRSYNGVVIERQRAHVISLQLTVDPELFRIPSEYLERSPSEAAAEFERRYGMPAGRADALQRLDDIYKKSKKP